MPPEVSMRAVCGVAGILGQLLERLPRCVLSALFESCAYMSGGQCMHGWRRNGHTSEGGVAVGVFLALQTYGCRLLVLLQLLPLLLCVCVCVCVFARAHGDNPERIIPHCRHSPPKKQIIFSFGD